MTKLNITEILERAMLEPTLIDSLTVACIWEAERAIEQARKLEYSGWETCFKHTIKRVFAEWAKKEDEQKATTLAESR